MLKPPDHPEEPATTGGADPWIDRGPVRLNRFLAAAGVASRRAVERLITAGRVEVNGVIVDHPGIRVDPGRDQVRCDGRRVEIATHPVYLIMNKPPGVLTTVVDPHQRRTVMDLLAKEDHRQRLFPVGRLDLPSEGLVLLTNDGTLAQRLLHPRYHVAKRYRVWTDPAPTPAAIAALTRGVVIEPGVRTRPAAVRPAGRGVLQIELREGRKRQIRRMCEVLGLTVTRLVRVALGPLVLTGLSPGDYRRLEKGEVEALWKAAGLDDRLAPGDHGG